MLSLAMFSCVGGGGGEGEGGDTILKINNGKKSTSQKTIQGN